MADIFSDYLNENGRNEDCRALTCDSYKNSYSRNNHKKFEKSTNFELATYGDALLNLALCNLLLDKGTPLSEKKKEFLKDKFLIEVVAKHYGLLEYMNFDRENQAIKQEYKFDEKNERTKYIATTVEAVLASLYRDGYASFDDICKLVNSWIDLNK